MAIQPAISIPSVHSHRRLLFAITFGYRRLAVTKQDEQIAHSLVGIAVDLCILARSQHGVLPSPNLISGD